MDNTNNQTNTTPNTFNPNNAGESKKVGPIIAILIIVFILIIAALYVFASRLNQVATPNNTMMNKQNSMMYEASVKAVTNTSDEPSDLQKDLDRSDDGLDQNNF